METNVVFIEKDTVKNARLKIIQYLISQGVFPESIKFSTQEIIFKYSPKKDKLESQWCQELSDVFKGKIEFHSKFPEQQFI
jgi:hypothetical protein